MNPIELKFIVNTATKSIALQQIFYFDFIKVSTVPASFWLVITSPEADAHWKIEIQLHLHFGVIREQNALLHRVLRWLFADFFRWEEF